MPIPARIGNFCECGCGETAKVGNRFIRYHSFIYCRKGETLTKGTRRRMSVAAKGRRNSNVSKERNRISHLGKIASSETKRKMSVVRAGVKNHFFGKQHTEESKRLNSKWHKEAYSDPAYKEAVAVAAMLGKKNRAIKNEQLKPNKPESKLLGLLSLHYPKEWKYVGDGSVIFGSRNPDFINVNGKKLIIELFGDYWHKNDSVRKRAAVFKPFGFRTLVIWERELKSEQRLLRKIDRFVERFH